MNDVKKLFDERSEQVGAVLMLLALGGWVAQRFGGVEITPDPELFWTVATAGAGIYGAKAIVLLKQVRERLDRKPAQGETDDR